jgi:predicted small metal-binding protein
LLNNFALLEPGPMKQLVLMLTVSCREIGMNCDYVAKGETEEELMKDAGQQALRDIGYKEQKIAHKSITNERSSAIQ